MEWLVAAAGLVVVLVVLRDIFHTLFHPSGQGTIAWLVMGVVWRVSRGLGGRRRLGGLAGPLAIVAAIGAWTVLVVLGWTLVYWPFMPEHFLFSSGLAPLRRNDAFDAVYLSLVTSATLGFGDIVPTAWWLRLAAPLQAVVGFALLTAAVSWVLQIYPALSRRRALAIRLALLRRTAGAEQVRDLDSPAAATLIQEVATSVVDVRVDLAQYAETYYFREGDPDVSLAAMLGYATALARAGASAGREDVRLAAGVLGHAPDGVARILDEEFFHCGGSTHDVFAEFARHHGHELVEA